MSGIMRLPTRTADAAPRLGGSPAITSGTGYPWEDGDILYADDLNSAFLPITGGALSGSSDATHPFFSSHVSVSGTAPAGPLAAWYVFAVDNDTADATHAQGGGATDSYFGSSISAGAKGGRTGHGVFLNQTGPTICPDGQYYVASGAFSYASFSAGGAAGAPQGALFASNIGATLQTGAGDWHSCIGMEIDVGVQSGCTAQFKAGLLVVQFATDAVRGSLEDAAISIGNQAASSPGWGTGLEFGSFTGFWPFTTTSTLIGTKVSGVGGGATMNAGWGIDLLGVTFAQGAFRSPGFTLNASGGISFGAAAASSNLDLTRHIALFDGVVGMNVSPSGAFNLISANPGLLVYVGGTRVGQFTSAGLDAVDIGTLFPGQGVFGFVRVGNSSGPMWFTGTGVPVANEPVGSLCSRTDGGVGSTLYVSRGGGTWAAVAGV